MKPEDEAARRRVRVGLDLPTAMVGNPWKSVTATNFGHAIGGTPLVNWWLSPIFQESATGPLSRDVGRVRSAEASRPAGRAFRVSRAKLPFATQTLA